MQRTPELDPAREPWIADLTVEQRLALLDELGRGADAGATLDRWSGVAARNLARHRLRELHRTR